MQPSEIKLGCAVCDATFEDSRTHDAKRCAQIQVEAVRNEMRVALAELRTEIADLRTTIADLKAFVGAPVL